MSEEAIYNLHRYPSGELEEFEYVQELVRCKECKYEPICNHSVQHTTRDAHTITIGYKSVEWCSYGERASDDRRN